MKIHLFQLFGKKLDEKSAKGILDMNIRSGEYLSPAGWGVILDVMPWVRHLPIACKLNNEILELAKATKDIIDQQIEETKVFQKNSMCIKCDIMCYIILSIILHISKWSNDQIAMYQVADSTMYPIVPFNKRESYIYQFIYILYYHDYICEITSFIYSYI